MTNNRMTKYEGTENNIAVRYLSFSLRHSIVRLFVIRTSPFKKDILHSLQARQNSSFQIPPEP